ncbi:Panacea domain-containing protein [Fusobacterium perfoetens]|uniref:Panacea domain-containing protein n=1 Tax=Fusobacterium perfoetens TaxID=852 RepID=UPI001F3BA5D0|nr:type II toxin-antitoxin system antitoxin SocA domain-containing protein [Fusobacterium perfoetens]MCF2612865.1 DUF4065 domain-containing protein [Fusobacterium perfoetens]
MTERLRGICSLILRLNPNTSNLVLQKLLYFIQAASLRYLNQPAFRDEIEAWQYGPVVPEAYREFKYNYDNLKNSQEVAEEPLVRIIEIIINGLGSRSAYDLVNLTHSYNSWQRSWEAGPGTLITLEQIRQCHNEIANIKNGFIF